MDKISAAWYGDPLKDPITQANFVTRFVSEFGLQQEALRLQNQLNTMIKGVNSFLGDETPEYSSSGGASQVDKIGVAAGASTSSVSTVGGVNNGGEESWADIFTLLPQTVGTMAVSLIKFITPKSPAQKRVDTVKPPSQSVSEVRPLIDLRDPSTVTLGVLGTAAIGSVAYALMASSSSSESLPASKQPPNNFVRFGSQYFLTDFSSKRSFENVADARVYQDKKHRRRRSSWKKHSINSNNHMQHFKANHLGWWPETSKHSAN